MDESVRQVSGLWIYPIKSLGGIALSESRVLLKGLQFDRRWMLVDDQHRFLTQRELPHMALFSLSQASEGFTIHHFGDHIHLPLNADGPILQARVWDDDVQVVEVSDSHNQWFTHRLQRSCKLVFFPEENARPIDPDFAAPYQHTHLGDGFPLLIIGESSLNDLNGRLQTPVSIDRFRPNIVFTGGQPFEEDSWRHFTIGDVVYAAVKPCGRCTVTTIHQQTGIAGMEPLQTLSTYRKLNNKVLFGQNIIPENEGSIKTGDLILFQ